MRIFELSPYPELLVRRIVYSNKKLRLSLLKKNKITNKTKKIGSYENIKNKIK